MDIITQREARHLERSPTTFHSNSHSSLLRMLAKAAAGFRELPYFGSIILTIRKSALVIRKKITVVLISQMVAESRRVIFVGATNSPRKIDSSFRRRVESRIWINLPTQMEKFQMLKLDLRSMNRHIRDTDLMKLASSELPNHSGDDIRLLCATAAIYPATEQLIWEKVNP